MRKPEIEFRKLRVLALIKSGYTPDQICEFIGVSKDAYRAIVYRLRKSGALPRKK